MSGKKGKKDEGKRKKLGVFEGVFLRVVSNLFGVMLYLRISWVAGQAGICKFYCNLKKRLLTVFFSWWRRGGGSRFLGRHCDHALNVCDLHKRTSQRRRLLLSGQCSLVGA